MYAANRPEVVRRTICSSPYLLQGFTNFVFQKFSTNKRQLNDAYTGSLSRFPWLPAIPTSSEQFLAIALPPNSNDATDFAQGRRKQDHREKRRSLEDILADYGDEGEEGDEMESGGSGESIGEMPIELRHLEGELDDYMEMEGLDDEEDNDEGGDEEHDYDIYEVEDEGFTREETADLEDFLPFPALQLASSLWSLFGSFDSKSRSLEDLSRHGDAEKPKAKKNGRKSKLADVGRASTYDEGSSRIPRADKEEEVPPSRKSASKNISVASLRSLEASAASGSLTSISSNRSVMSNVSVQSDSGLARGLLPQTGGSASK